MAQITILTYKLANRGSDTVTWPKGIQVINNIEGFSLSVFDHRD